MATLKIRNPDGSFSVVSSPEVAPHGNDNHTEEYFTKSAASQKADLVDGIVPQNQLPPVVGNVIDILYSELVTAMSASGLFQGQFYRITDFQTKRYNTTLFTTGLQELHIGPIEPLIVLANSTSTINIQAYSEQFPYDIIHYNIYKPIENDSDIYGGNLDHKGTIIYRKDTIRNLSTYYDFRNVYNRRWNTNANPTVYNQFFDIDTTGSFQDFLTFDLTPDVNGNITSYNIEISPLINTLGIDGIPGGAGIPNNIVIKSNCNTISIDKFSYNIDIGPSSSNITLGKSNSDIIMIDSCSNINTSYGVNAIKIGSSCSQLMFESQCNTITLATGCYSICFGINCNNISFTGGCQYINLAQNIGSTTFGAGCVNIVIGCNSYSLIFEDNCNNIKLRSGTNNTIYLIGTTQLNTEDLSYYDLLVNTTPTSAGNFIYDVNNNISSFDEIKNGTTYTVSFTYNGNNKVLTETKYGKVTTYEYDINGKLTGYSVVDI